MCIPCDKAFHLLPYFLTSWPWPWSLTYFWKNLTMASIKWWLPPGEPPCLLTTLMLFSIVFKAVCIIWRHRCPCDIISLPICTTLLLEIAFSEIYLSIIYWLCHLWVSFHCFALIEFLSYHKVMKFWRECPACILSRACLGSDKCIFTFSFTSGLDPSLMICKCLQSMLHWLLLCVLQSLQTLTDMRQQSEYVNIIDAGCIAIQRMADSNTVQALLYIAMSEDIGMFFYMHVY